MFATLVRGDLYADIIVGVTVIMLTLRLNKSRLQFAMTCSVKVPMEALVTVVAIIATPSGYSAVAQRLLSRSVLGVPIITVLLQPSSVLHQQNVLRVNMDLRMDAGFMDVNHVQLAASKRTGATKDNARLALKGNLVTVQV